MRGEIANERNQIKDGLGLDSCGKTATPVQLLWEEKAVSPSAEQGDPAGQDPVGS